MLHFLFDVVAACFSLCMRSQGALVDATDDDGETPMHTAASLGLDKVVAVLLHLGADQLLRNANG